MDDFAFAPVHITDIRPGDIVLHEGATVTVGPKDIKRCPFMGVSIFGDSYSAGHRLVPKAFNFYVKPIKPGDLHG